MSASGDPSALRGLLGRAEVRRSAISLALVLAAVALSLFLSVALIGIGGVSPSEAISALLRGVWGSPYAIGNTVNKATDLLLVALGVIVAGRAGLLNVGGEGQLYAGAIGALLVATASWLPAPLAMGGALVGAAVLGAVVAAIAALMKVRRGVSEVITTLLLNFVMIEVVSFLVHGPLMERQGEFSALPRSEAVPDAVRLPILIGGSVLHSGIVLALVLSLAVWWMLRRTTFGLRLKVVGDNPRAAHHVGVSVARVTVTAFLVSGALCGLAGATMLLGEQFRVQDGFSPGYGFDGIVVALIARSNPIGAVLAAVLLGALRSGSGVMEASVGVPSSLILVTQGLVVLFVAGGGWLLDRAAARSSLEPGRA